MNNTASPTALAYDDNEQEIDEKIDGVLELVAAIDTCAAEATSDDVARQARIIALLDQITAELV